MKQNGSKVFVFVGRPGSGKGTQAGLLIDFLKKEPPAGRGILYIYSGERLRDLTASVDNPLSRRAGAEMNAGGRLPDFMAIWAWTDQLLKELKDDEHIIFDGSPRSLSEAQVLETALRFLDFKAAQVIFIEISPERSRERLLRRGRLDDKPQDVTRRLSWFGSDVAPVLDYYRERPDFYLLSRINGEQPVEDVHRDIVAVI